MTAMNTATEQADGGRQAQLTALQERMTWPGASMELTKPLLCSMVPPRCFHTMCKRTQQYTQESGKRNDVQVSHTLEQSSVQTLFLKEDPMTVQCFSISYCQLPPPVAPMLDTDRLMVNVAGMRIDI